MKKAFDYLEARLIEGSTWAGFAAVFASFGMVSHASICGLLAVLLKDKGADK